MPEKSLTDLKSVKALGHAFRLKEVIARVVNVCRPYNQNPRDLEYKWHRQLVKLEDDTGEIIPLIIYTDKMHLASSNEGQVWRFRSLNFEDGARGLEVNKWQARGSSDINFELKLNSWGDACRLPYLENQTQPTQEDQEDPSIQIHSPETETMPTRQEDEQAAMAGEVEELVISEIRARRDVGRAKYGTTMERTDIDPIGWLQHALEEHLDAAIYTRRLIRDLREGRLVLVPADELDRLRDRVAAIDAGEFPAGRKPKPETDARIHEMNEEAERQLAERRGEGSTEPPVEKPGRNSKAPHGSDPYAERRGSTQPQERHQEEAPSHAGEMITRSQDLQFIAMEVRWAYDESADDDQVRKANDAMLLRKQKGYSWEEVFDALTGPARARGGEGKFIDIAVASLRETGDRARAAKGDPPLEDEQVYEGLCKYPKQLRQAVDNAKKVA